MQIFNNDDTILFDPDKHRYTTRFGKKLTSVTRVIKKVIMPFDRLGISLNMAKQLSYKEGISVKEAQKRILDEWEAKRVSAENRGNFIHDNLEKYLLTGECDITLNEVVAQLQTIFKDGHRYYTEARTYVLSYMVAGTGDLVVQRQRGNQSVFDFYDYKTNEAKGIQFDSINRKKVPMKHYNKFLMTPLNHLEDCNYNQYALQLSLYALMAQLTWGLNIGKLAILYIDNNLDLHEYPVPYMKLEARVLLEHNQTLKPLPIGIDNEWDSKHDQAVDLSNKQEDDW